MSSTKKTRLSQLQLVIRRQFALTLDGRAVRRACR